jgi:hypothetical protein
MEGQLAGPDVPADQQAMTGEEVPICAHAYHR